MKDAELLIATNNQLQGIKAIGDGDTFTGTDILCIVMFKLLILLTL